MNRHEFEFIVLLITVIVGIMSVFVPKVSFLLSYLMIFNLVILLELDKWLLERNDKKFKLKYVVKKDKNEYEVRKLSPYMIKIIRKPTTKLWYIVIPKNGKWYYKNDQFYVDRNKAIEKAIEIIDYNMKEDCSPKSSNNSSSKMTKKQAAEILGLTETARADSVKARSKQLLTVLHPDKGGSNYLASQINQAKDVLLG